MIHTGDCVEVMAGMEPASVDAIVTDPPYGLEFMGKEWDSLRPAQPGEPGWSPSSSPHSRMKVRMGGEAYGKRVGPHMQQWHHRWATEAFRVAKPGAYLLAFGGTRTYHRMTCAIEDAGWIIRDCLVWAYASGFPKSKALLKPAWEPIVMARKPGPLRELAIDACRIATDEDQSRPPSLVDPDAPAGMGRGAMMGGNGSPLGRWPANLILTDPIFDGDTPGVVGGGWQSGGGNPARQLSQPGNGGTMGDGWRMGETGKVPVDTDGTYSRFFLIPKADRAEREPVLGGHGLTADRDMNGSPVRNARCAKCGRVKFAAADARCSCAEPEWGPSSTGRANHHPTVKPLDLMRHLVRLVTPAGGTVLDPFLGSGTTALAAEMEGFGWIGIEKEPEYVAIAEARLNGTQRGFGLGA